MRKALEELVAKWRSGNAGASENVGVKASHNTFLKCADELEALLRAPLTGAKGCCLACGAARETAEEPVSLELNENQLREVLSHCIYDPIDFPLAVQKLNAKLRRALARGEHKA